MKVKSLLFLFLASLLMSFSSCQEITSAAAGLLASNDSSAVVFPVPLGSVSDYEKILTDAQIRELDSLIVLHEMRTKQKINIVTVKSIAPYSNQHDYSVDLLSNWDNGDSKDNSVLIVFSEKRKEVQITTGLDLKRKLTDKECRRIVKKTMLPELEEENYFFGLKKGLKKIITELQ